MKQNKRQATIFIVLFTILFILALTASYVILNTSSNKKETVKIEVKDVSNKLISYSSGEEHVVDAEITLEITGKDNGKIDKDKIISSVKRIMTQADYDKISKADGMEYIKSEINNYISQILPDETETVIYFTTLLIDDPYSDGTGHRPPEPENDQNDETLKGLFEKIGD